MPALWLCCILVAFTVPTFAFSQCKYDGKLFQPFTPVYKFYDEKRDWCSVGICRSDGTIWKLIDLSCRRKTTQRPTDPGTTTPAVEKTSSERTTPMATTIATHGDCLHEGKAYSPGSEIFRGVEKNKNVCYTLVCSVGGDVIIKNKRRCRSTVVPPAAKGENLLPTSSKQTLEKTEIMTKEGKVNTTANSLVTTDQLQSTEQPRTEEREVTDSLQTSEQPRTRQPVITDVTEQPTTGQPVITDRIPTTEQLKTGKPEATDRLHTADQPRTGQPETTDQFEPTEQPRTGQLETMDQTEATEQPFTTPPYTTVPWPETTPKHFTPFGCYYDRKYYRPGSTIYEGYDESSDWCYGAECSSGGSVIHWDTWNCKGQHKTTAEPTTAPPMPHHTTDYPTTAQITKFLTPENNLETKLRTKGPNTEDPKEVPTTKLITPENNRETEPRTGGPITKAPTRRYITPENSLVTEPRVEGPTVPIAKEEVAVPTTPEDTLKTEEPYTAEPETIEPEKTIVPSTEEGSVDTDVIPGAPASETTVPRTTAPPLTTISTRVPTQPGCHDNGKFYPPGSDIHEGYDESSDWCYGSICDANGQIISWDTWNCKKKSTTPPTTTAPPIPTTPPDTTPPYFTTPPGCYDNGKFYPPGSDISEGYDESSDWCYGSKCDENGQIISWDTWNCKKKSTTPPTTTAPPIPTTPPDTTPPYFTTPPGCYDNGKFYPPGSDISKGYHESRDLCYGSFCDKNGKIVMWDTWNCKRKTATPPATTAPPIPTTPPDTTPPYFTTPPGCYNNGKFYPPGSDISEGYDESSDWCYGSKCDENGQIIRWDTWNCKKKSTTPPTTTAPPIPTTLPDTTPPFTTTPPGCYDNGKFYPPGSEITVGYDESSDWCYGSICDENGQIISWDTWNCKRKSTTPPATTTPPMPTTLPDTTPPSTTYGCFYDGRQYEPEEQISEGYDEGSNWCYGLYCGHDGQVSTWDKFNCKSTTVRPTTTPLQTTTPPPLTLQRCYHKGRYYVPGQPIIEEFDPAYGLCYDAYCGENGYIVKLDEPICKGPSLVTMTKSDKSLKTNPAGSSVPVTTVENDVTMPLPTATTTESDVIDSQNTTATTTAVTFNKKCFYDGRYILPGEDVYRKYDEQENWCYGLVCDESSSLVYWEKLNCKAATTTPRPLLSLSLESIFEKIAASGSSKHGSVKHEKEEEPQTPKRCLYKGLEYMVNQFIKKVCGEYGKCSVLFCNHNGIVVPKLLSDITRKEDTPERGFIFRSTKEKLSKGF